MKKEKIEEFLKNMYLVYSKVKDSDEKTIKHDIYHHLIAINHKDILWDYLTEKDPNEFHMNRSLDIFDCQSKLVKDVKEGLKEENIDVGERYNRRSQFYYIVPQPDDINLLTIDFYHNSFLYLTNTSLRRDLYINGTGEIAYLAKGIKNYFQVERAIDFLKEKKIFPKESSQKNIKIYFGIDNDKKRDFLIELAKSIVINRSDVYAKVRPDTAKDTANIRIYNEKDLKPILEIAKKYKNDLVQCPLMPTTEDGIGITFDNGQSYNDFLGDLLFEYFKETEVVNYDSFITFIKEKKKTNNEDEDFYKTLTMAFNNDSYVDINQLEKDFQIIVQEDIKQEKIRQEKRMLYGKLHRQVDIYLDAVRDKTIEFACIYGLDYAYDVLEKALNNDDAVYHLKEGDVSRRSVIEYHYVSHHIDKEQMMEEIEYHYKRTVALENLYQEEYQKYGKKGIQDVSSKIDTLGNSRKYPDFPYWISKRHLKLLALRRNFPVEYNEHGAINKRKFNEELAKSYEREKTK